MTVPATGSMSKFLPLATVVTLPSLSGGFVKSEPVMLNVAWFSGLARFVMVTWRPGEIEPRAKTSSGRSIVFAFQLSSSCSGKSQVPGKSPGFMVMVPLTSSGAPPFPCANTVGAAIVSARMTLRANTIARFTVLPPIYFVVVPP
jgi:hypothetical protein